MRFGEPLADESLLVGARVVLAVGALEKILTVERSPSKKRVLDGMLAILHALRPGLAAVGVVEADIPPYWTMRSGAAQSRGLELRNLRFAALELLIVGGADVGQRRTSLISVWAKTLRYCLRLGYVLEDVLENGTQLREPGTASGRRRVRIRKSDTESTDPRAPVF